MVISGRQLGQRAVLKFGQYTGCQAISGRYTPGTFTNQLQKGDFREPRLLVVTDPRIDSQVCSPPALFALSASDRPATFSSPSLKPRT